MTIAYKGFDKDLKCRDFKYKVGKTYTINVKPELCERGFHACYKLIDINKYYSLKDNRICEVEILGDIDEVEDKVCTNKIKIVRELSQKEIVELLKAEIIKANKDINAKDNDGWTALTRASTFGYTEVAEMLIEAGADVNAKDSDGWTALIRASYYGYTEIVELLINAGVDVNIKNKDGKTVLMFASTFGYKEIVKLLIKAGADVNAKDSDGWTALIRATDRRYTEIVELLINAGVDVNIKNKDGKTALIHATDKGYKEVVEVLIEAGADVNIKNKDGKTALIVAARNGTTKIVKLLIKAKADVNIKDNYGKTALMFAVIHSYTDIAELLTKASNSFIGGGVPQGRVFTVHGEDSRIDKKTADNVTVTSDFEKLTTITINEGGKEYTATSRLHPLDKFSIATGIKVAAAKLEELMKPLPSIHYKGKNYGPVGVIINRTDVRGNELHTGDTVALFDLDNLTLVEGIVGLDNNQPTLLGVGTQLRSNTAVFLKNKYSFLESCGGDCGVENIKIVD